MKTNRILFETILIIAVTLFGMWFVPAAKTLFALIPIAYLLIRTPPPQTDVERSRLHGSDLWG